MNHIQDKNLIHIIILIAIINKIKILGINIILNIY